MPPLTVSMEDAETEAAARRPARRDPCTSPPTNGVLMSCGPAADRQLCRSVSFPCRDWASRLHSPGASVLDQQSEQVAPTWGAPDGERWRAIHDGPSIDVTGVPSGSALALTAPDPAGHARSQLPLRVSQSAHLKT